MTHTLIYALALLGMAALLLALTALYADGCGAMGKRGLIGYLAAFLGTLLVAGDWWFEAFVVPTIDERAPDLLDGAVGGSILAGAIATIALYSVGWVLFGLASLRARTMPRPAAALLIAGGLIGPLLRSELRIVLGRVAMALRLHSGRRRGLDPVSPLPPDSLLAKDAEMAAEELLSPALLNSTWLRCSTTPDSPARCHTSTSRCAVRSWHVPSPTTTGCPGGTGRSSRMPSPCTTPPRRSRLWSRSFPALSGAGVDVFGLRSHHVPDAIRRHVVAHYPRSGFMREFVRLLRAEARQVPHGRAWYLHRFAASDATIRLAPFRG